MTRRRKVLLALAGGFTAGMLSLVVWVHLPLPRDMAERPEITGVTLLDRHGIPLRTTRAGDGSRVGWLTLDEMDPQLLQAFIALEDRRFYRHHGVDLRAAARALIQAVREARVVSGASTITMQLAHLLRPAPRSVRAKLGQARWALRIERHLTKQQILEQYLNRIPLGEGTVGVGAAAALYFGADAASLSLGQAAMLAGLASAPSVNNPFRSAGRARARRARALDRMVVLGYATPEAAERARREPVAPDRTAPAFLAPHFTSRVLAWVSDSTERPAGRIATSLDLELQAALEAEVRNTVVLLREREARQAAAVVLDNATGEILAWVGSPDFWADTAGQVDMVVSPRQPGSALKPFLYALALDRGYTAASVLPDVPRAYRTATGPYQPRNYDRRFHGPVRIREALASSFNVPAVELTDRLGAGSLLRVLRQAGFVSLRSSADHYGLGLSLGNGDVTLLELANGYRALAAGGLTGPVRWTAAGPGPRAHASDARRMVHAGFGAGRVGEAGETRFASRGAALMVLDILTDADARIPGFGVETPFDFPFPVAVKTGTSHRFTDNWAVGVTGGFTVVAWVGNFSGRPMRRVSGVTGAGPLLYRAVMATSRRYEPGVLPAPAEAGASRARICRLSGRLAGVECPGALEWFLPGTVPVATCDWHPGHGAVVLPQEYAEWAASSAAGRVAMHQAVTSARLAAPAAQLRIVTPLDGDRYAIPPETDPRYATLALRAVGAPEDEPLAWYVDGRRVASERWALRPGAHVVRVVGASGRFAEARIDVR